MCRFAFNFGRNIFLSDSQNKLLYMCTCSIFLFSHSKILTQKQRFSILIYIFVNITGLLSYFYLILNRYLAFNKLRLNLIHDRVWKKWHVQWPVVWLCLNWSAVRHIQTSPETVSVLTDFGYESSFMQLTKYWIKIRLCALFSHLHLQ